MREKIGKFIGEYWFLSNFYPAEIELDGLIYPTLEHAYQASKTKSKAEREVIRKAKKPGQAKFLGKRVTLVPDWDTVRVEVMRKLLVQKFANKVLRAELLSTGDADLEEGNYWNDRFWGVCKGRGENQLGKLLMEIREELRAQVG